MSVQWPLSPSVEFSEFSSRYKANRSSSHVIIKETVFEKVLESRFCKHVKTIVGLKGSLRKCSSEYFVNEYNLAHKLNRYKNATEPLTPSSTPQTSSFRIV